MSEPVDTTQGGDMHGDTPPQPLIGPYTTSKSRTLCNPRPRAAIEQLVGPDISGHTSTFSRLSQTQNVEQSATKPFYTSTYNIGQQGKSYQEVKDLDRMVKQEIQRITRETRLAPANDPTVIQLRSAISQVHTASGDIQNVAKKIDADGNKLVGTGKKLIKASHKANPEVEFARKDMPAIAKHVGEATEKITTPSDKVRAAAQMTLNAKRAAKEAAMDF
jgi:DNA repair ATPase RecN